MIRRLCNCFCLMMILCVLFVPFGLISSMWREPYSFVFVFCFVFVWQKLGLRLREQ